MRSLTVSVLVSILILPSLISPGDVLASQLPMGLENNEVYVQEYRVRGAPYYAIANWTSADVSIEIQEYSHTDDGAHFTNETYGPIVAKWRVAAGSVASFSGAVTDTMQYVRFLLDGKRFGMLNGMKGNGTLAPKAIVTTNSSMNYWGGGQDDSMWFEQESIRFNSDTEIEVTLAIRANAGEVAFGPYTELGKFINSDRHMGTGQYTYDFPIPLILPTKARSSTLKVNVHNGLVRINTGVGDEPGSEIHRVTLSFRTPKAEKTSPVIISGFRLRRPGWGGWVVRMLVVDP